MKLLLAVCCDCAEDKNNKKEGLRDEVRGDKWEYSGIACKNKNNLKG